MNRILAAVLALALISPAQAEIGDSGVGPIGPTTGGNTPGTTTNDNAAPGNVGEIKSSTCPSAATTATVTISLASPGVITWTSHGFTTACPVVFTTTGSLPVAIVAGTVYYVVPSTITTNTFSVATTLANALAGTGINTASASTPTTTGTAGAAEANTTAIGMTGLALTAGDWDCVGQLTRGLQAGTSNITVLKTSINTSIADGSLASGTMTQFSTAANVQTGDHTDIIGPVRISLSSTTNYFLIGDDAFSAGTTKTYGTLRCRRMR